MIDSAKCRKILSVYQQDNKRAPHPNTPERVINTNSARPVTTTDTSIAQDKYQNRTNT